MFWHHIKCIEMTVGEYNTFQFQPIVGFVKTVKTVFFQILQIHALKIGYPGYFGKASHTSRTDF
jgi:hypothetical protein